MRYHYEKPDVTLHVKSYIYTCNHPVYNRGTIFRCRNRGLIVIQQRYNQADKSTSWGEIDPWLVDSLYSEKNFGSYLSSHSRVVDKNGLYPTVTIRQIMWALRMKPLPKERWETAFTRKEI